MVCVLIWIVLGLGWLQTRNQGDKIGTTIAGKDTTRRHEMDESHNKLNSHVQSLRLDVEPAGRIVVEGQISNLDRDLATMNELGSLLPQPSVERILEQAEAAHPQVVAGEAARHFQDYLAKCPANEIRCIWFWNDRPLFGMLMTIDLRNSSVHTVCEVHDWASQNDENRKLSYSQVTTLKKLSGELPPSDMHVELRRAVSVSIRKGNDVQIFRYDRRRAPAVIQRIYDIGGGYFSSGRDD